MKLKLLIAALLFQATIVVAQEKCGFTKHQDDFYSQNPDAKIAHDKVELELLNTGVQEFLTQKNVTSTTVYEIPVVVHLMNDGTTPLKTDAEIITWIENCNKFYNTTYGGDWLTEANGGTVIPFKLVLAKRSPSCTATTGINQINVTSTYSQYTTKGLNSNNSDGVTANQLRNLSRWDPQVYYNIYVVNTFDSTPISQPAGLQGYASFPTNPDNSYDTFMKASVVTNTNDPTTLPHEFAHSMGLDHPFKTGTTTACPTVSSGCAVDNDKVCDTPSTKSLLGVNPLPTNSDPNPCDAAGWNNVQYNVMNYTSSSRLFTAGQKDRAVAMFLASRENLTKSLGGTALPGSVPATVAANTCTPQNTSVNSGNFQFGMTLVEIGTIKNTSSASNLNNSNKAYYDYTTSACLTSAFTTDLIVANNPQTLKLKNGGPNPGVYSAWIDYNNDGAFTTGELIVTNQTITTNTTNTFNFAIPPTGVTVDTPLRMRVIGDSQASSTSPCGQLQYGEVEDYIVVINPTMSIIDVTDAKINISPNPSLGIVNIKNDKTISEVSVINIKGQTLFNKKYNQNNISLDIKHLPPAMYFLRITSEDNTITKKIIRK